MFTGIKWTDTIIAIFTVVLAIYTARLYFATAALADADRPHMIPAEFKISGIREPPIDGQIKVRFTYRFINYGRSPAFMNSYSIMSDLTEKLHGVPQYGAPGLIDYIIAVNGWYGSIEPTVISVPMEEASKILAGKINFFIFGYIKYSDTAGQHHKMRFAYKFLFGQGNDSERFIPDGPDTYREYT